MEDMSPGHVSSARARPNNNLIYRGEVRIRQAQGSPAIAQQWEATANGPMGRTAGINGSTSAFLWDQPQDGILPHGRE